MTDQATTTTLPAGLMPDDGWIRRYVDLYTPMSEAAAEAHLATAMAVLSAAVGWRAHIQWGESREPCNLFILLEGGSATAKKTTTSRTGSGLVRHAMRELPEGTDAPLRVESISHTSRRGLLQLIGTPDETKAAAWEHTPPPGFLLDWDEFGATLGRPGDVKGADWLGQVRATIMELYSGRHGGIKTGEAQYKATRCAVSILATMTRQELEQRMTTGLLRDGFMGRFVLIPHPGRTRYLARPPKWTHADSLERTSLAMGLRRIAMSAHELGSIFDAMTDQAAEAHRLWYERRMPELDHAANQGGEADIAIADAMGRLQTTAVKVAAVLAISDAMTADGEDTPLRDIRIDWRHVEGGIAFAEHALNEIRSLASTGGSMTTDRYAVRVVEYLKRRNGKGPIGRSSLLDNVKVEGMDRRACWNVVRQLHEEGRLTIAITKTNGRPKETVTIV